MSPSAPPNSVTPNGRVLPPSPQRLSLLQLHNDIRTTEGIFYDMDCLHSAIIYSGVAFEGVNVQNRKRLQVCNFSKKCILLYMICNVEWN